MKNARLTEAYRASKFTAVKVANECGRRLPTAPSHVNPIRYFDRAAVRRVTMGCIMHKHVKQEQFVGIKYRFLDGMAGEGLKGNSLLVLTAVMRYLPHSFPSVRVLSRDTGLNRKTIFRHLKILEGVRALQRMYRHGRSNIYKVNPALLPAKVADKMTSFWNKAVSSWNQSQKRYAPRKEVVPVRGIEVSKPINLSTIALNVLTGIGNGMPLKG